MPQWTKALLENEAPMTLALEVVLEFDLRFPWPPKLGGRSLIRKH